jgi:Ca-activated chloride channel family protein
VVFLTDGLPTVGETDAGRILSATASLNPLHARIFTFGVGYDVNTFLLDQLAARNGGAADYITPDEDLEVKLSNFFARVSSPVMSDLALDLGPMQALEVYPKQLPDLFRGTQITLLGRYTGSGSVALTLRGRVRGQARTLRFEARPLPAVSADNDFLPRLWAMRKVGFLLEQIRISGESAELKNEIVRLAKKYGFVTPYTSMLAADEKDLFSGARPPDAVPLQTRDAGLGGLKPAAPAREAVAASIALGSMKRAEVAAAGQPAPWPGTRQAGGKTFADRAGVWTDTAYDPAAKLPVVELGFASDALLQALAADRRLAAYAAIGRNVVVVHLGKVYRIRG